MGIGFRELLIILAIALVIFGAKRLKTIGSDLGGAVKGFKKAMAEGEDEENKQLRKRTRMLISIRRRRTKPAANLRTPDAFGRTRCSKSALPRSC
jgi:sec-independent protein translocase protein TatA